MENNIIALKNSEGKVTGWMHVDHAKHIYETAIKQYEDFFLWGTPLREKTEEELYRNKLRYALVDDKIIYVHTENMKGYQFYKDGVYTNLQDLSAPLIEVEYNKFIRWARGMDL